ncbi:hypothetical protein LOAG_05576, partial [Loa loa]
EVLILNQESTCGSWETANRVRIQQRKKIRTYMSFVIPFIVFVGLTVFYVLIVFSSKSDVGNSYPTEHERRTSIISSIALYMNHDDFVRHLQSENTMIPVIDSCQHTIIPTPVPNEEASESCRYSNILL